MKISISEALRLKGEISNIVKTLEGSARHKIQMGRTLEDGIISSEGVGIAFNTFISTLENALSFSEELNNKLAMFNKESGIDSKVRKMQNHKLLYKLFSDLLPQTKAFTRNTWVAVNTDRKKAVTEYFPLVSSSEIKEKMNFQKNEMRLLQAEIEKLNQKEIELSFSYTDLENLVLE